MIQRRDEPQPGAGGEADPNPEVHGWIAITPLGGSHSCPAGQGSARVEWVEGSSAGAKAQFALQPAGHPNSPPPPLQVTDLSAGENSILIAGGPSTAQVDWQHSGESGAGTFSWSMGGLPVDASGWSIVSEVTGPQQGDFHIAFAKEPTSRLLSLDLVQPPPDPRQVFIRVCVDGNYVGTLADRCQMLIMGKVVTLGVDCRADPVAALMVGYSLRDQGFGGARSGPS